MASAKPLAAGDGMMWASQYRLCASRLILVIMSGKKLGRAELHSKLQRPNRTCVYPSFLSGISVLGFLFLEFVVCRTCPSICHDVSGFLFGSSLVFLLDWRLFMGFACL